MTSRVIVSAIVLLLCLGSFTQVGAEVFSSRYQALRNDYSVLRSDPVRRQDREAWLVIIIEMEQLIASKPPPPPRLDARMRYTLGMMYFGMYGSLAHREDLVRAHEVLSELVLRYPNTPLADDALFFRGEILHKLNDDASARAVLLSVLENYPEGNRIDDAQFLLSMIQSGSPSGWSESHSNGNLDAGLSMGDLMDDAFTPSPMSDEGGSSASQDSSPESTSESSTRSSSGNSGSWLEPPRAGSSGQTATKKGLETGTVASSSQPSSGAPGQASSPVSAKTGEKTSEKASSQSLEQPSGQNLGQNLGQNVGQNLGQNLEQTGKQASVALEAGKGVGEEAKGISAVPPGGDAHAAASSSPRGEPYELDAVKPANSGSPPPLEGQAELSAVKVWTNPDFTRVVFHVDRKVSYSHELLRRVEDGGEQLQLTLYLKETTLTEAYRAGLAPGPLGLLRAPASGGVLHSLALEPLPGRPLRVVMELGALSSYRVTPFQDPARILIDLFAKPGEEEDGDRLEEVVRELEGTSRNSRGDFLVVLDPGHGGSDPGAIGPEGTYEKDVALAIALKVKEVLSAVGGVEVVMTRDTDVFVPLEARTSRANEIGADLFVSIHANAVTNSTVRGIETYFLDAASDEASARLASRENASLKDQSFLDLIVADLVVTGNVQYSEHLARLVHNAVVNRLRTEYSAETVRDLGVKSALFYVLFGAQMPCILIETSFITHPVEEARLRSVAYQAMMAGSIADGILNWRRETGKAAGAGSKPSP